MKMFADIWEFLTALRFVDIIFFMAVLILMILIVTLIYYIMNNEEEEVKEETAEMKIVKEIKENSMNSSDNRVVFTDYEKDQEDKAIISYDELVSKGKNYELNYETEEVYDDVSVKKVDLDNLVNKRVEQENNMEVRVISFAKEEAFLEALKRLQQELG